MAQPVLAWTFFLTRLLHNFPKFIQNLKYSSEADKSLKTDLKMSGLSAAFTAKWTFVSLTKLNILWEVIPCVILTFIVKSWFDSFVDCACHVFTSPSCYVACSSPTRKLGCSRCKTGRTIFCTFRAPRLLWPAAGSSWTFCCSRLRRLFRTAKKYTNRWDDKVF